MYNDDRDDFYMDADQFVDAASGSAGHEVLRLSDIRRTPRMIAGIACAALATICLSCFVYMLFLQPTHTASAIVVDDSGEIGDVSDNRANVTLPIYIPDLDARSSRIPVAITGNMLDGTEVSKDTYISRDGSGLRLEPGTYELRVSGSPVSSSGVMYRAPEDSITITVTEDLMASYEPAGFMVFSVIAAIDVTDEQIDAAIDFIKKDPERTQYADSIAEEIRDRRSEAIAANRAAQAAKEEAVRVVAEQQLLNENISQQDNATQNNRQTNTDDSENGSSSSGEGNNGEGGNSSGSDSPISEGGQEIGGDPSSGGSESGSDVSGGDQTGSGSDGDGTGTGADPISEGDSGGNGTTGSADQGGTGDATIGTESNE